MSFVSYAQNYEDVMLWRALRHVERGFYIDVGAWSPDLDSVTRAFSDRGWRGINIEPNPHYFAQLVERRPADINLSVAVGDRCGTVSISFIPDSGLSTADAEIARRHAAAGWMLNSKEVELTTLANIWAARVPDGEDVHFLKVDVEGFERAVLTGNDWRLNRPWIVVVEATLPTSQVESHGEWEWILLQADYLYVYADGLNRYYVAKEHAELVGAFKYPPNVFDGFVTGDLDSLRQRFGQLEGTLRATVLHSESVDRSLVETQQRLLFAEQSLVESRQRIECAEEGLIASRRREQELRDRANVETRALAHANRRAELAMQQYDAILRSTSWRLTAPLRKVVPMLPKPLLRQARRAVKAAWWVATPWRIPERLRFIRNRGRTDSAAQEMPKVARDFFSDEALLANAALPHAEVLWPAQAKEAITDTWSAARWCIDFLRFQPEVRARFPKALSQGADGNFAKWLMGDGGQTIGLSSAARQQLGDLLGKGLASQARQFFLFRADVRENLPHGLTSAGRPELFRWFMQHGRAEGGLRSEEILWLFLEAAEDPALELARAYLFTPSWQRLHPDGLTVFGREAFAGWFSATYGAAPDWVDPSMWPDRMPPSRQLRQAYYARPEWQACHPAAFDTQERAALLVDWLRSEASDLSPNARAWCEALTSQMIGQELAAGGVNLIGHFCCPSGVRVSAEALVEGMKQLGIQTSLRDVRTDIKDEPNHVRFDGMEDFEVTIVHTQPEPFFDEAYRRSDLAERQPRTYRIAYWYWEFDSVPESWMAQACEVDEVWTATEFVAKGLRERLSIPVKTMFPGVQLNSYTRRDRRYFGLQEGKFTFLFNFHMNSVMERKNPLGLIKAFKTAFGPNDPAALVLKTMFGHHHPAQIQELRDAAAGSNITVIDQMYSPDEVLSLMDVCDAYVSLHRSEGLGLTMAEAMLMGKPVIATNYSGNIDFMDDTNSLLVPCELVKLGRSMPPYDADLFWAEPSVEHAAAWMRRLFEEPDWSREVGARGKASAEVKLSIKAAGRKVAQRLEEIKALRGAMAAPHV